MTEPTQVPEQPEQERIWTVTDVAAFFQVSKAYIYELVKRRQIPHGKIGRLVRFEQAEILKWWDLRRRRR